MKLPPNLEGFQNEDPVRFLELVTRALMGQSEYNTQLDLQERQDDENENETRTNNSNATDPRTELQRMLDEELELSLLYDEDEAILEYEREQSVRSENNGRGETLHYQSRSRQRALRRPTHVVPAVSDRGTGKRSQRRREQLNQLMTDKTVEEEEDYQSGGLDSNEGRSMFSILLEDPVKFEIWSKYGDVSAKDQHRMLHGKGTSKRRRVERDSPSERYARLEKATRQRLRKVPISQHAMISQIECDVIGDVFLSQSRTFEREESSKFSRLVIHAVAKFHKLMSVSTTEPSGSKTIKVFGNVARPRFTLAEYLAQDTRPQRRFHMTR
eukprot:m.72947 g.72947  ORF g.72947 m.72947 type:complete len:327 (-) comp12371_c0_seq1:211-1191(-)